MKNWLIAIVIIGFLALASASQAAVTLTLTWQDNSDNETGFIVERKVGPATIPTEVTRTGINAVTFVDTNLVLGTQYCYQIKAFNAAGMSAPSNIACASTPTVPAAPGNVTVTVTVAP